MLILIQIESMGATNPMTCLVVDLTGPTDPDDSFSTVPYEKGQAFLWYLEDVVGGPSMKILKIFKTCLFSFPPIKYSVYLV